MKTPLRTAKTQSNFKKTNGTRHFALMDALTLCVRSTSLGDIFTGVLHPATASHREMSPKRRQQLGITEGLVRISVGIEDVDDIVEDIKQALEKSVGGI